MSKTYEIVMTDGKREIEFPLSTGLLIENFQKFRAMASKSNNEEFTIATEILRQGLAAHFKELGLTAAMTYSTWTEVEE